MRVYVSLPTEDVEFIDDHIRRRGARSRSAALQEALRMLRHAELVADYTCAWEQRDAAACGATADALAADGIG
jgi:Arc/MetJ-type ribon-helix-helix transcriptional regulator